MPLLVVPFTDTKCISFKCSPNGLQKKHRFEQSLNTVKCLFSTLQILF